MSCRILSFSLREIQEKLGRKSERCYFFLKMFIPQNQNFSQRHFIFNQLLAEAFLSLLFSQEQILMQSHSAWKQLLCCLFFAQKESLIWKMWSSFFRDFMDDCPRATLSCTECREAEQFCYARKSTREAEHTFCHVRKRISMPWDTRYLLTFDLYFFALFSPCGTLTSLGGSCSETSSWVSPLPPNTNTSLCWS